MSVATTGKFSRYDRGGLKERERERERRGGREGKGARSLVIGEMF